MALTEEQYLLALFLGLEKRFRKVCDSLVLEQEFLEKPKEV